MALTITIPGAVSTTTGSTAPAVLTVGAGPPGQGVPSGGSTGQVLKKLSASSFDTGWGTDLNAPAWGTITGTLSTQTDLQAALDAKLGVTTAASTYQTQAGMTDYLAKAGNLSGLASLATSRNNLGLGSMALATAADYSTTAQAAALYYPLSGNPSAFLTASALTPYLLSSTAASTYVPINGAGGTPTSITLTNATGTAAGLTSGNVTTNANLTGVVTSVGNASAIADAALSIGKTSGLQSALDAKLAVTVAASTYYLQTNPSAFITSSALTPYATLAAPVFTGDARAVTAAVDDNDTSIATTAYVVGQAGSATPLIDGTAAVGTSLRYARADHVHPTDTTRAALAGATFTGLVGTVASATATAGLNVPHGVAPTAPVNGDLFTTTSGLFARINGGTQQYAPLGSTNTFSGTNTFSAATVSFGTSTAASTVSIGTGATLTATTKAVNIGTNGVAGSTTNIAIGSTTGTSTTTLQGTTNGITSAADTNSVALATTAYVVGQAGSAAPLVDGTATVGTSLRFARQDHVHPTDTSRAALASPTFTGTPLSTTAAVDTNTTQIATTAYVVAQAASATPLVDGTAAVGTSLRYARADHVHPTDTSRAPLASPTFTGTVTIPSGASISGFAPLASPSLTGTPLATTAAVDTNTTQIATTAYVVGQGYAKLASPTFSGTPSLPTGTTAITQTAGNNTTALATTAFVTTAVPLFATNVQAKTGTSTTLSVSPSTMRSNDMNPRAWQLNRASFGTAVVGVGATVQLGGMICYLDAGSVSLNSALCRVQSNNDASFHLYATSTNGNASFSDKLFMSGRCGTYTVDDSAKTIMISFGKTLSSGAGDLSSKGVGLKHVGGSSTPLILTVHNGTTLTNVNSSYTPVNLGAFDWEIYSDGAGNVTLTVNGTQVASTASGPIGACATSQITYQEEIYFTATPALSYNNRLICARGKLIFGT